jgi:hypothetical protein
MRYFGVAKNREFSLEKNIHAIIFIYKIFRLHII